MVIGAREIYDAVLRVGLSIDRLALRMDAADVRAQDHEQRLRTLERGRWPLPAVSVLLSVSAVVLSVVLR